MMPETCALSADVVRIPLDPEARLRGALRMLATRLAEQREAMAAWRENCAMLSRTIQELADSCNSCQRSLDDLDVNLAIARASTAELGGNALRLAEQAGRADDPAAAPQNSPAGTRSI